MPRRRLPLVLIAAVLAATGCGGGTADDPDTIDVAYHRYGNSTQVDALMQRVKQQYEQENPGKHVALNPVVAPEGEYLSKLQLRMRSAKTAPDVLYEDSFTVNSDVAAGYLAPLDERLAGWADWDHFIDTTKQAGRAADGRTYGIPLDTDTRGIWFNRDLFARAGLPADWEPDGWDDVLDAARRVKQRFPDVIGLDLPLGKAEGEAVTMQTVLMLLHGTGTGALHDGKWIAPNAGFTEAMRFLSTAVGEGLTQSPAQIADAQYDKKLRDDLTRQGKVAMRLDGSFASGQWESAGWRDWPATMSAAPMPARDGGGTVSMSGGWTLAMSASGSKQDDAFAFLKIALNRDNVTEYALSSGNLPSREDSAADPRLTAANPLVEFWLGLLEGTHYRPTLPEYPKISEEIQQSVLDVAGGADPEQVSRRWTEQVRRIAGPDETRGG